MKNKPQANNKHKIIPNNVIASSLHLLAENQKNLKCVVDKERAKMSQRGKRQSRLDNDEPPPTKKRKGRPPANKTNSSNLGNGNPVHPNATESKCHQPPTHHNHITQLTNPKLFHFLSVPRNSSFYIHTLRWLTKRFDDVTINNNIGMASAIA